MPWKNAGITGWFSLIRSGFWEKWCPNHEHYRKILMIRNHFFFLTVCFCFAVRRGSWKSSKTRRTSSATRSSSSVVARERPTTRRDASWLSRTRTSTTLRSTAWLCVSRTKISSRRFVHLSWNWPNHVQCSKCNKKLCIVALRREWKNLWERKANSTVTCAQCLSMCF